MVEMEKHSRGNSDLHKCCKNLILLELKKCKHHLKPIKAFNHKQLLYFLDDAIVIHKNRCSLVDNVLAYYT